MTTSRRTSWTRFIGGIAPLALLLVAACGSGQPKPAAVEKAASPLAVAAASSLETFDSRYVQIDACPNTEPPLSEIIGCGSLWGGDANLFTGNDSDSLLSLGKVTVDQPHPSQSAPFPAPRNGKTGTFIDWDSLTGEAFFKNHFRADTDTGEEVASLAFPGSNSCVGPANVLDKMNLTFVSVSNNPDYAFFGVQRRDNSGDAGYMWIFNKIPPPSFGIEKSLLGTSDGMGDNCQADQYPLTFRITKGDVLFRGHFAPGTSEPLLSVYTVDTTIDAGTTVKDGNTVYSARCPATGPCYVEMPAKSAINWRVTLGNTTDTLWLEDADYVAGVAVNTGIAGLGAVGDTANTTTKGIGRVGLKSPIANNANYTVKATGATWKCTDPNGCMQENLFAEVAVGLQAFLGNGSVCGATFYGSVISRSSGTTPSPDMKDLAGPFEFNFGAAAVTADVTATCGTTATDAQFKYKVGTYTGIAGGTVNLADCGSQGCSCAWYLDTDKDPFASTCNYEDVAKTVAEGKHTLKLVASDGSCPASVTRDIEVYPLPTVSPSLTSGCVSPVAFGYAANAAGVHGTPAYAWTFTGGYSGSSATASGSVSSVSAGQLITGSLTLTDDRGSGLVCEAVPGSASTTPWAPISVSIAPKSDGASCTSDPTITTATDAIKFQPTISGGSGKYVYAWTNGSLGDLPYGACSEGNVTSSTCTFDPADSLFCVNQTFKLTVTDLCAGANSVAGCPPAGTGCVGNTSNQNTYGKVTTVTATNK